MKTLTIVLLILSCLFFESRAQSNIGINDDNSAAKASAMLDIYSTTKGLLIPRVMLISTTAAAPVTSPEASLLIYNTATTGDVIPGYYYWNGISKWVRLVANADPVKNFNMVTKSASATLLKTENIVLASGDITLTLPTITSADDGLEIVVKNVGSFTDLITVIPESGKNIDGNSSFSLTRWRGRAYVAYGSNWIAKIKETTADNLLDVGSAGSFATIAEVIAFLNSHMTGPMVVRLGGEIFPVDATQIINLPYPVTFEGTSFGETTIEGTAGVSGTPLFDCQSECYYKMLMFNAFSNAAGNDAIHFSGSGIYYEVKDSYFSGFNKGIVSTSNSDLWIFETDFENCTIAGIEIAAGSSSGGSLKVSETDFTACAKGIHLLSGVSQTIAVQNCTFYNALVTETGLFYVPGTFISISSIFLTGNSWNNIGTFFSGFDFSRSDGRDANVYMTNNNGKENENPHCKVNVKDNLVTTTITNLGTYYKANWTNTSVYTCKWTIVGNRITYQPKNKTDVWSILTGNISVNDNKTITIAIFKNGNLSTSYGESDLRIASTNSAYQFSTVIYVQDLLPGDYLEVFVTSSSNSDVVTFRDVHWYTEAH